MGRVTVFQLQIFKLLIVMLRFCTWNMRGAMYGTSYFQSILEKSDICLLTEHWLNKSNISFLENFDSRFDTVYSIGMNCSSYTKGSGGTAILVRKSPGYKIYNLNLKNDRICGIKLCSNEYQDICVLCVLLPSTNYTQEVYLKYLDDLCKYYDMYCEDNVTLIGGDFNIDITNQNISGKAVNYIEFLKDRNLCPAPLKQGCLGPMYTFRSKDDNIRTLLDYVCIPEFISNDIPFLKSQKGDPSYHNYKLHKREFRKHKRQAEKQWQEEKYEEIKSAAELDIEQFYKRVRRMRKPSSSINKLIYNGNVATDDVNVCEMWSDYFHDLYSDNGDSDNLFDTNFFKKIKDFIQTYIDSNDNCVIPYLERKITIDEVSEQLRSLKCGKAPGPDYLCNEHLLYGGKAILTYVCKLYDIILKTEYIPLCFRHGIIITLYKGNNKDKSSPNNYRAVTLTSQLIESKSGLIIEHLADDTTLLSSSKNGLQILLNIVHEYAQRWRLKYNALKSKFLLFSPKKYMQKPDYVFSFGDATILMNATVTYAGTLLDCSRRTFGRTDMTCKKLKRKLHSLYNIGVNPNGMSPVANTVIWKRVILPCALYACELWGHLNSTEIGMLEQAQRYFTRFILCFDKRSPNDSCISNLGLWTIEGLIDKFKILFLGRLCRASVTTTHKQLFNLRLGQIFSEDLARNHQ
ncbi:unnamed protein product [Mytilus coruscus]|uniref:Endonuclease/exonuclease/phosphatase domain-containing protein n=1 Tax=Mytilus coruscus TaxID=42192 RepID=A0A6J8C5E1_MYTCO|nr:unnamed protein product [Mytilus coruscus]